MRRVKPHEIVFLTCAEYRKPVLLSFQQGQRGYTGNKVSVEL